MKTIEGEDSQQLSARIRFDSSEEKQTALRLLTAMHQKLIGPQKDKEYLLCLEDACFTASNDKRTFLYTAQGCYESMLWLCQMEEQLNGDFVRINKTITTNMEHVTSMHADLGLGVRVYLDTGHQHMITRTYVKTFKQKLKGE